MKSAKIEGFFTNHCLRHTGGTRLFQAGVDRKLVKETTGHSSDAVDAYQITSDQQRAVISKILAVDPTKCEQKAKAAQEKLGHDCQFGNSQCKASISVVGEISKNSTSDRSISVDNIVDVIKSVLENCSQKGKTIIKLEIEVNH